MSHRRLSLYLLLAAVFALSLTAVSPARGQEPTPESDANCVSCHQNRYYLYDSGKYYCLCEAPMHCIYCHGGRTDSYVAEIAHEGLVLYPTREQAERCRACHAEDYLARAVKFASIAGVSSTPQPILTATPQPGIGPISTLPPHISLTRLNQLAPWRLIGLGVLGVALILVIAFGYRCWKLDCLSRRQSS